MFWFSKKPDYFNELLEHLVEKWQMRARYAGAFLSAYRTEISVMHEQGLKRIEDFVKLTKYEKFLAKEEAPDNALVAQARNAYLRDLRRGKHVGTDIETAIWAILCNRPDILEYGDRLLAKYVTENQATKFPTLFDDVFDFHIPDEQIQRQRYVEKAVEFEKEEDWAGLLNHALTWTQAQPEVADAWSKLGIAYGRTNQLSKAIEAFQEAIGIDPDDAAVWSNLGVAYSKNNQPDKSIEAHEQAILIYPEFAMAWNNLGIAYTNTNQFPKAIEASQQAIRINPDDVKAWKNLGATYYKTKQLSKAIEAYQQAVRVKPDDASSWNGLGNAYMQNNQLTEAIEAYQQAILIYPEFAMAWSNLGIVYGRANQPTKAIEAFQEATRIKPDSSDSWNGLGIAYGQSNQLAKAIEAYQQAVRIKPDDVKAWYNLGVVCKNSGQTDNVMEVYKRLKTIDPDVADVFFHEVEKILQIEAHNSKKRILVVDPDSLAVETLSLVLKEQCGYDCFGICFNGAEQQLMEQIRNVDTIVMAIVMPGFSGTDLTKKIRNEGLDIPIILTTGWNTFEIAIESMKSGADDLILKPIGLVELTSSIEAVLKRSLHKKGRSHGGLDSPGLHFQDTPIGRNPQISGLITDCYDTGELLAESSYKDGKLDGICKVYRKWGQLLFEGCFKNGLADGSSKWFNANGQVYIEEDHKKGDRFRRKNYENTK